MKKPSLHFIILTFIIFICAGCGQSGGSSDTPDKIVDNFLSALQQQNYASAKSYYAENLDNLANFRNQVEDISPSVASALFKKLADFSYTIDNYEIASDDPNKATVTVSLTTYDLGKSFESTVLDYIKTDLKMSFDGAKSDDIIKQAEDIIVKEIDASKQTFSLKTNISLTKEKDTWKLDKLSDNPELLNALCGNILSTIDSLSNTLNTIPSP